MAPTSECVLWRGTLWNGYGYVYLGRENGRQIVEYAHRLFYRLYKGPIAQGLNVHHVCGERRCVNPLHLELVSRADHMRLHPQSIRTAIERRSAGQRAQTHCKRGHEFTPENTYRDARGHRVCRTCERAKHRRLRAAGRKN